MYQKILIIHKHNRLTGVSTFIHTITKKLHQLGHEIHIYIENKECRDNLLIENLTPYSEVHLYTPPNIKFDQVFFNYNTHVSKFNYYGCIKKFFVHGLMNDEYVPPLTGIDKVYTFGERAYDFVKTECKKVMIRNGIDLERFKYAPNKLKDLEKVLVLDSRNNGFVSNILTSICGRLGIFVTFLGINQYNDKLIWNVEDIIKSADLVIGYGRSAYEAMAIGRPVIVYGYNGGDGYITKDNFPKMLEANCSGWSLRTMDIPHNGNVEQILTELMRFRFIDGAMNRALAEEYLNIDDYMEEILSF